MLREFIEHLESQVGKAVYVWGGQGQVATEELIRRKEDSESNIERVLKMLATVIESGIKAPRMFDCSGLGMYFLQNKKGIYGDMTANSMMHECKSIAKSEVKKGDWVFKTDSKGYAYHIGYVVDELLNVIEAQGRDYGVVKRPFAAGNWTRFGRPEVFRDEIEADLKLSGIIRRDDEGDMVKLLQEMLIAKGYGLPKYGADGEFGSETEAAVRKFQKDNGLIADGIVGEKTIAALNAKKSKWSCSRNLKLTSPYMKGNDVKAVQKALDALDYAVGQIDGVYGKRTKGAVMAFQEDKNLTVDGIAGKKTITALGGIWED